MDIYNLEQLKKTLDSFCENDCPEYFSEFYNKVDALIKKEYKRTDYLPFYFVYILDDFNHYYLKSFNSYDDAYNYVFREFLSKDVNQLIGNMKSLNGFTFVNNINIFIQKSFINGGDEVATDEIVFNQLLYLRSSSKEFFWNYKLNKLDVIRNDYGSHY